MPVHAITENGAPSGERHLVLMDPEDRPAHAAIALLKAALARELRTIVYTQSRKLAELVSVWAREQSGRWRDRISVYRAGLSPDNRRDIEHRLKSGELLAVVSTSALELGSKAIGWAHMFLGEIRITDTVLAYDMMQSANGRILKQVPIDAPPVSFETQGIWNVVRQTIRSIKPVRPRSFESSDDRYDPKQRNRPS